MPRQRSSINDIYSGTVDGARFLAYARSHLIPNLGNYFLGEKRSIVVLDNATTHPVELIHIIEAVGARVIFQAAYSPDLNPIEYCFHEWKSHLKRHNYEYGLDPYHAHMIALADTVPSINMRNYYRKVGGIRNVPSNDEHIVTGQLLLTILSHMASNNGSIA